MKIEVLKIGILKNYSRMEFWKIRILKNNSRMEFWKITRKLEFQKIKFENWNFGNYLRIGILEIIFKNLSFEY